VVYTSLEQKKHLDQFSDDYIWQLKTSIKDSTHNFLLPAKNITKLGAYLFEQGLISLDKPETLSAFVQPFIDSYPQFNGHFVGTEQKEFWFWHNTYADNYVYRIQTIKKSQQQLIEQKDFLDAEAITIRKSVKEIARYDPTSRLWYKGAKNVEGAFWSDVYSFDSNKDHLIPGVTASYPIYDKKHNLLGVWGVDIVLQELSSFLFDAGSQRETELVIFNDQNQVIAYSGFKELRVNKELITLNDLKKPTIEKALNSYEKHGFNEFYFNEYGVRYLASYSPFLFGDEQDWHLLLVVPESKLVEAMGNDFNLIALFAVLVLLISAVRFIVLLRQPLLRFRDESTIKGYANKTNSRKDTNKK